jgi:DNA invertase Pin-like site-specific DNA recombinase
MLVGYARVSTTDQNLDLQKDALQSAGCERLFTDTASGATAERPGLTKALQECRPGDTLVVWKLDRLGRSLPHLVETVRELAAQGIGFKSLQENLDTTTSGGKLIFHLFASLAEFERDIIRERTKAGLTAARARGRKGGRPKGVQDEKKQKAALALKNDPSRSVAEICEILNICRNTYYKYVRSGEPPKRAPHSALLSQTTPEPLRQPLRQPLPSKMMRVKLVLGVEGNNKYIRGKSKAREEIERWVLGLYNMEKLDERGRDYRLTIPYETDEELDTIIYQEILAEADRIAGDRNCSIDTSVIALDELDRSW